MAIINPPVLFWIMCGIITPIGASSQIDEEIGGGRFSIEGRVFPPDSTEDNWQIQTRVHVNSGEYIGFVRQDGSFVIHNVPSGSYVVDILHPDFMYEPARVEINSKGKYRARQVNYVQTTQVIQLPYPLRMKPLKKIVYFQTREHWRVTDFLLNPVMIMMVIPLILIMMLPKIMSDPETREDLKRIGNLTKMGEMPDMSEMITSLFNGKAKAAKQLRKRQ